MQIAIIGTGSVGAAIARGLKGKGHDVTLGARDPASDEVAALAAEVGATAATQGNAAAAAEMAFIALPWFVAENAVKALGDLSGKIVVDCMNPLGMVDGALGLTVGHSTSGGEILQEWLPGARVVKALNQVGAETMADNAGMAHRPAMFTAGDDEAAKQAVAAVLGDLGFDAHDAGGIAKSRLLEPFAMLWINQALFRGKGRAWAFAAVDGAKAAADEA